MGNDGYGIPDTNCVLCAAAESQQSVSSNNSSRASSSVKINVKSSSKPKQRSSRTPADRREHRRTKRAAVLSPRANVVVAAHYDTNNYVITESGPDENWEQNTEYDEYEEEEEEEKKSTARGWDFFYFSLNWGVFGIRKKLLTPEDLFLQKTKLVSYREYRKCYFWSNFLYKNKTPNNEKARLQNRIKQN